MRKAVFSLVAFALAAASPLSAQLVNPPVVISQVYGGGGNSGAPLTHDFIEIFNRTANPVSLAGWSLQYASATGTGNFGANSGQITELPAVVLGPGQYFLVQEGAGTGNGVALPTPDLVDPTPIAMAAGAGKVALVNTTTALGCNGGSTPCSAAALAQIVDLVGYGSANFFEGSFAAPTLTNSTAALRGAGGCTDTNINGSDFVSGAPSPRNTSSPFNVCGTTILSGTGSASPNPVSAGSTTLLTVAVTPASGPVSTGITVQADLTAIGGSAAQAFLDNGAGGDVTAGDNTFSFLALVSPATTVGPNVLPFTASDAQSRTANGSFSLTVTAIVLTSTIHAVQGPGNTSALTGQTVKVRGVVTGVRGNSFYIQTKPGLEDSDPASSEGILVFTGAGNVPAVVVEGNEIEVTGVVVEFVSATFPSYTAPPGSATLTELGAPLSYSGVLSSGNVITPQVIDSSVLSPTAGTAASRWSQLERFEGMLVTMNGVRVTQNTNSQTIFGTLTSAPTPYRETGVFANKLPTGTPATLPIYDANPEVIRVEGNGLNGTPATFDLAFGSTISSITGVLDFSTSDGIYSLRTNALGVGTQTPASLAAAPMPAPLPTDFTVATMNVNNFVAATQPIKVAKISLAIRTILHTPDVIGFQEVDELASLQTLASQIDSDAIASGQTPPNYTAALLPGNANGIIGDNDFQNVGFLYKASKFTGVGAASQFGTEDNTYVNPLNQPNTELTFDRPPLVISGTAKLATSDSGVPFTVVVNHLKSLIDLDNATTHPSDGGLRNQAKRHFGAADTAALLSSLNTTGVHLVSVGDHNAYQFNDGYVDVINCIRGLPPAANMMIYQAPAGQACPALPADKQLINLTDGNPIERYSYIYLGTRQTLDHILVNSQSGSRLRTYATSNMNADFPAGGSLPNNAARAERFSDHNPQMAYFSLPNEVTSKVAILKSGLIYNRALGAWTGTVTVRNDSGGSLAGPLHVFFHNLPTGVTLANAAGTVNGVPYVTINATLSPGQSSAPAAVRFSTTPATSVTYNAKTYSMTY